jgi:hypothetical protein
MRHAVLVVVSLLLFANLTSYNHAFSDGVTLYHTHSVSGSDAISTDTLYRERCFVHVEITIKSAHHGPYHRNNPDKTFYPGDAFDYEIDAWTEGCRHFQPCPVQSTPNLTGISHGPDCVVHGHDSEDDPVGGTYGSSADSGTATVSPSIGESEPISVTKMASAEQYTCHKSGSTWHCGWPTVSTSASYFPPVILPYLEVIMEKDGYEFTEDDGYTSRNLDKSYYVWDAINVIHNPIYKWKNERVGTIFAEIDKDYSPLTLEDEFFCDAASCTNTMNISGFLPWTESFDYGGGNTIYNATSLDLIGNHTISYNTRLYNIVPQIDVNDNSTSALVVEYEPVYDAYVYPVLSDDQRLAFDDRIGIALHYFGSESTAANPDDDIGVHEDRRSKINNYFYSTWGADPWEYQLLDGTVADTDYSDELDLVWDEAHDVGIVINELPVKISEDISDKLITTEFAGMIPFEVQRHTTANFVKSGYGKIFFDYPGILGIVYDDTLKIPRFENATVFDTLQSRYFAGHDVTHLTFTEYMYPESFFYNQVTVTAVNSDGNQDDSVEIQLDITPRFDITGTKYLDEYMYDKIFYDSKDDGFSQIITGLDMDGSPIPIVNDDDIYPMDENYVSGFGSVTLDKTRRTASLFTQYGTILPQSFSDDVTDISEKYLLDSQSARLPIPLTTGLHALSPFHISITADDGTKEVTNTFDNAWHDFSVPYKYWINMNDDNTLDIKRDSANPRVLLYNYDSNFGAIEFLQINDIVITGDELSECLKTRSESACVISVPQDYLADELVISSQNIWGGTAKIILPKVDEHIINPPNRKAESLLFEGVFAQWIAVFLGLSLIVLIGYLAYKKYLKRNE